MSRTTDPVLVGSRAAAYWGQLPHWRGGRIGDTDVFCTPDFAERLAAFNELPFRTNMPGRGLIGGLNIDTTCASDGRLALLNELSDERQRFTWSDEPVLIAPIECVWAMRVHTIGFNPHHHAKAVRDAAWYNSLELAIDDRHRELARLCYVDGLQVALSTLK